MEKSLLRRFWVGLLAAGIGLLFSGNTAKANDTKKRIVILGDSITAGYGLELSQAYPALIQQKIEQAKLPFVVVNAGVSGDTSAGGEGEPEEGENSESEEPDGEGGRQDNQENPQGDRPEGDEPETGDEGEDEGKGEPDDNDLKRAEKEGGDLRSRLLRKQQQEYLRNGRRIPRSKSH